MHFGWTDECSTAATNPQVMMKMHDAELLLMNAKFTAWGLESQEWVRMDQAQKLYCRCFGRGQADRCFGASAVHVLLSCPVTQGSSLGRSTRPWHCDCLTWCMAGDGFFQARCAPGGIPFPVVLTAVRSAVGKNRGPGRSSPSVRADGELCSCPSEGR
jgi:hypothetical protein